MNMHHTIKQKAIHEGLCSYIHRHLINRSALITHEKYYYIGVNLLLKHDARTA